jgi:Tol biopolymer transport system component
MRDANRSRPVHRHRPCPAAFYLVLLAVVLLSACSRGGSNESTTQSTPAGTAPAAVAASGHGLLLPRDQRLFLRDMASEKEYVLRRAEASAYYTYPRWSPDGKRIAYALDVTYTGLPSQNWGSDIALINTDGSGEEQIVFRRPASGVRVEGMAWSPDSSALFVSLMETNIKDGRFLGQTLNLERLDLATGERRVIVPDAAYPSVSPDGSLIAYITFSSTNDPGGLWVARADGTDRRLIVPNSGRFVVITHPRFSPDGSTIAFSAATFTSSRDQQPNGPTTSSALNAKPISAHGLPQDIWLISASGGEPTRLTTMLEDEPTVAWSPDGTQIAIIATGGLYVMNVEGGEPRKLGPGGTLAQIDWR